MSDRGAAIELRLIDAPRPWFDRVAGYRCPACRLREGDRGVKVSKSKGRNLHLKLPGQLTPEQRELVVGLAERNDADHGEGMLGLVLSGSAARGMATERSDLDIYVVLTDEAARERRPPGPLRSTRSRSRCQSWSTSRRSAAKAGGSDGHSLGRRPCWTGPADRSRRQLNARQP